MPGAEDLWVHRYSTGAVVTPEIGGSTPEELASKARDEFLLTYAPRVDDIVVDVGAGVGGETYLFSQMLASGGRVISIEAHPRTFACLEALCSINDLRNVTTVGVAAAAADGHLEIGDGDDHLSNSVIGQRARTVSVPARRLEQLLPELGVGRVDFLKINIEGGELDALRGAGDLLARVRHVAVACHDFLAGDDEDSPMRTKTQACKLLRDAGFDVTERADARPWVRDTVYGTRSRRTFTTP